MDSEQADRIQGWLKSVDLDDKGMWVPNVNGRTVFQGCTCTGDPNGWVSFVMYETKTPKSVGNFMERR